jgi:3-methylcrotonyl-CoA carboxylase alpha subunit
LARHPGFAAGEVDTGLIARDIEALVVAPVAGPREVALAALAGLDLLGDTPRDAGFVLWAPLEREVRLIHGDEEIAVRLVTLGADAHDLRLGDMRVVARRVDGRWRLDGQPAPGIAVDGNRITVFARYGLTFDLVDPLAREGAAGGDATLIEAPMPGLVKAVYATPGQAVAKGDRLAVLEAMKMEHSLLAARDGVVAEVLVAAGDQVSAGAALVRLEEESA